MLLLLKAGYEVSKYHDRGNFFNTVMNQTWELFPCSFAGIWYYIVFYLLFKPTIDLMIWFSWSQLTYLLLYKIKHRLLLPRMVLDNVHKINYNLDVMIWFAVWWETHQPAIPSKSEPTYWLIIIMFKHTYIQLFIVGKDQSRTGTRSSVECGYWSCPNETL